MNQQTATSISREVRPSKNDDCLLNAELSINLSIFRDLPPLDSNGMPITTTSTTGPPVMSLPFRPRATHMITQQSRSNHRRSATTATTSTSRFFIGFNNSNSNCDSVATRSSAFSPTTRDDMIEREQLWKLQPAPVATTTTVDSQRRAPQAQEEQREPSTTTIDFAVSSSSAVVGNEETAGAAAAAPEAMDCDDFSVSSREADSLLSEQDLENISKDPVSFWEGSIDTIFAYRSVSPDQNSMERSSDNDQETTSFLPSPTSVTAIASIVGLSHK